MDDVEASLAQAARQAPALAELEKPGVTRDVIERLVHVRAVEADPSLPSLTRAELFFGEQMQVDLRETVSRHLYLSGSFEQALSLFFFRYLQPGMTFLDVGAHYGYFSRLAANRVGPSGRVIALEPTPSTFTMLSRNLAGLPAATAIQTGAWKSDGEMELNDFGPGWSAFNSIAGIRLGPKASIEPQSRITVPVRALDRLSGDMALTPDVVKIDVESAELEVLQGMDGLLRKARPIVTLEVGDFAHLIRAGVTPSRVFLNYVRVRGYVMFETSMAGLKRHIIKTTDTYGYDNIIGVPAEKIPTLAAMRTDIPVSGPAP